MIHEGAPRTYQELTLSLEEISQIGEIVSLVNQSVNREYPGISQLKAEQVKFVANISDTEKAFAEENIHPFFRSVIKNKLSFGALPREQSWVSPFSNTNFFDERTRVELARDKIVGLGIGMDLISGSLMLGAQEVNLDSERSRKAAHRMVTSSYKVSLKDIATEKDLEEAIKYMDEKGVIVRVIGMTTTLIVEEKLFLPSTGLRSNELVLRFLARPVKEDFVRRISDEFDLSFNERMFVLRYIHNSTSSDEEKKVLEDLARRGFAGRRKIFQGYISGDIEKKIVEDLANN